MRIPDSEIDRVKRSTDLVALVRSRGIEMKKHGSKDWIGRCPFHADKETPNFIVSPDKGLYHCMVCGLAGNAIQFVQKHDGVSFRHAFEVLAHGASAAFVAQAPVRQATVPRLPCPLELDADDMALMDQALAYYRERLQETPAALEYLKRRGIEAAIEPFGLGFADRTLGLRMPHKNRVEGDALRTRLQKLGLIRESGHEHFNGCVVFPIWGGSGLRVQGSGSQPVVTEIYGRKIHDNLRPGTAYHLYLPGPHVGIFNRECLSAPEIILCEAVIDALTFWVNGLKNVTCIYGTEGFSDELLEALRGHKTQRVYLAYDRDDAGDRAAGRDAEKLQRFGIECFRVKFPHGMDANEYARKVTPADKSLRLLINAAEWLGRRSSGLWVVGSGSQNAGEDETALPTADGVATGHRSGAQDLSTCAALSQIRDVCPGRPDAASGGLNPGEHCGGSGSGTLEGVRLSPERCQGEHSGTAHTADRGAAAGVSGDSCAPVDGGRTQPGSSSIDRVNVEAARPVTTSQNPEPATQNREPSRNPELIAQTSSLLAASVSSMELAAKEKNLPHPRTENPELILTEDAGSVTLEIMDRQWRARGVEKNDSFDLLKVNLCLRRMGQGSALFHLDTLDLYQARQRQAFVRQAAEETGLEPDLVARDMTKVLMELEGMRDRRLLGQLQPVEAAPAMTSEEREEALALLKDPQLLNRILSDFNACGVVGESTNKLTGYLAAVSRLLDRPLGVIVQSTSAAGKSTLMEAILAFVPEEHRVKYSAMTGQSLYYLGDADLRHKVLAIVEEEGAEKASYALKLLQSEGELTIASTGKDPQTGKMVTQEYHVEGPVMIFLTTTAVDVDEELLNRCLVLTVDEGREQTEAIHRLQREQETFDGLRRKLERERVLTVHRNAQRLLQPLHVVNAYAPQLTFLSDRTRTRRDHMKYLTLIRTITLLHQHQREACERDGVRYLEVTLADIEAANRLAHEVLGRSLDELPPQTRRLLGLLDQMARQQCDGRKLERSRWRFTRREVREFTGWGNTQLKVHLARLEDLEYLAAHRHPRHAQGHLYELLYDGQGQDGSRFLPRLLDVTQLCNGYDSNRSGQTADWSGAGRAPVGGESGGGRIEESGTLANGNKALPVAAVLAAQNARPAAEPAFVAS